MSNCECKHLNRRILKETEELRVALKMKMKKEKKASIALMPHRNAGNLESEFVWF